MNPIHVMRAIGASLLILVSIVLESCIPQPSTAASATQALDATQAPTEAPTASPSLTPAPSPTPYPLQAFKSSRFGYSVSLPVGWAITEKPGKWDGKLVDESGDAGTDIYGLTGDPVPPLEIGVLLVKSGTTSEQWAASEAGSVGFPDCTASATMDDTTVAGYPAKVQHVRCQVFNITNIFFVHGDRGYMLSWGSEGAVSPTFARAVASLQVP